MKPVLHFEARLARSREDLAALIEEKERCYANVAVADLTLGSWAPKSLSAQWFGQLTNRDCSVKGRLSAVTTDLGDAMSAGIDQEGRGNRVILDTTATVKQLSRLLDKQSGALLVLTPAFGNCWRVEDQMLLEYLRSFSPNLDMTLVVAGTDAAPWPAEWVVSLAPDNVTRPAALRNLPGLLPTAFSPAQQAVFANVDPATWVLLANGWAVVAPEFRGHPAEPSRQFTSDEIKLLNASPMREFAPYATLHSSVTCDPWPLCLEAWNQFGSGYRELALHYICVAEAAATAPEVTATLACHKQSMRIAMCHYVAAGDEPAPNPSLSATFRAQLMQTKGWGLVMSGNGKAALPFLREALELSKPKVLDVPYLYLMNITALAEVRSGNFDCALELELAIDHEIRSRDIPNARLIFVNGLNLARLHRYSGNLDSAEFWYRRAFSTVDGGRSDIDSINANLSLARVEEGRKDARANFLCWLRASLCWVATDHPEALNWRVQNLVFGNGGLISINSITESYNLVEKLAEAFLLRLQNLSVEAGLPTQVDREKPYRFDNLSSVGAVPSAARYVGGDGWGIIAGTTRAVPRAFGPYYSALTSWLGSWISSTSGNEGENGYWVDRRHGTDGPSDWPSFVNYAADLNISQLNYEGMPLVLGPDQFQELQKSREVRLNPMVISVKEDEEKMSISFRRYFPTLTLTGTDALVFRTLRRHPLLTEAKQFLSRQDVDDAAAEAAVSRLRASHVFEIVRSLENVVVYPSYPAVPACA